MAQNTFLCKSAQCIISHIIQHPTEVAVVLDNKDTWIMLGNRKN